jgi:hypothetical protein
MLAAVEAYFLAALEPALPKGTPVTAGPSPGPAEAGAALVEIVASRLTLLPVVAEVSSDPRQPAHLGGLKRFTADGVRADFPLPDDAGGEVVGVESPPGRPLRRGDDYYVEGRVIRLYRAPPAAAAVLVRLRGERARGYAEERPARIDLAVRAWAPELGRADELLGLAVGSALVAAVDLASLDTASPGRPEVRLHLARPVTTLAGMVRSAETVRGATSYRVEAQLGIEGTLELVVALGQAEAGAMIKEVAGAVTVSGRRP